MNPAPLSATERSRAWNAAVLACPGALDLVVPAAEIEGELPRALRGGQLLSNGPGWTHIGDRTAHPFDGHGYLRAFQLQADGSLRLRARFIDTRVYRDEAAAGRLLHRGLGTNVSDHFWRNIGFGAPRNVANTTILRWGQRLLAGWEGGPPHAVDPQTLHTVGEETFGGAIAGQATLAHMHHDPTLDRLLLCSIANGRQTTLTFRELDRQEQVVSTRVAPLDGMVFAHDFAFTPRWYVLGGNPLRMKWAELAKMALGGSTMLKSIATDLEKPGVFHLISRRDEGVIRTVSLPDTAFVVHFANAFERADGAVVIDVSAFPRFELGEELGYTGPRSPLDPGLPELRGPQRLYRVTVAPEASSATWTLLTPHGVDFPRVHPGLRGLDTPLLFGATRADTRYSDPFDAILRLDLRQPDGAPQLWQAPGGAFTGEPVFVPDPARDDAGHLLVLTTDGLREQTKLLVFDASNLPAGPVASVPLPLLPVAFHGDWDPAPSA